MDEVKKQLPQESVIYYGDLARVPFGSRSREEIIAINKEIISFLVEKNVKIVLIACNTSSSFAIEEDRKEFDVPILGLIEPGSQEAVKVTKNGKIGIIATEGTVASESYVKGIKKLNGQIEVFQSACPKFVSLVEDGKLSGREAEDAVNEYLQPLIAKGVDTIVHGCTHYPYLENTIKKVIKKGLTFVNPAVGLVANGKEVLDKLGLLSQEGPVYEFVASKIEGNKYVRIDGRGELLGSPSAIKV